MKKAACTLPLILALLSSILAGTCLVSLVEANPEPAEIEERGWSINILSPKNSTYFSNHVYLTVEFWSHFACGDFRYSLDGSPWEYLYGESVWYHYDAVKTVVEKQLNLSEGSHIIFVKFRSNTLTLCANVTFTVNMVSPYLSIMPSEEIEYSSSEVPLDLKYNFTEIPTGYLYTSSEVSLNFVTSEASDFNYRLDGKARVFVDGNITLKDVSDGVHSMVLYGKTVNGTDFASEPFSFWVDTGKPQITFLSLQNDTVFDVWNLDLIFYLSEPSPEIKYSMYGNNQIQTSFIAGNISLSNLPSGSYRLVLSVRDSVSNFVSFQSVDFHVANPLLIIFVVAASVIIIVIGLFVYFKKRK